MEQFQTEEQQVEAIKQFWKENGTVLVGGFAAGLAAFVGFNFYKDSKLESEMAASDRFQTVVELAEADKAQFLQQGDKFIQENGDSSYAALTALALAKDAADEKAWDKVAGHLQTAIDKAPSAEIKAIATIRLARVQVQQNELEKALSTLSAQLPNAFNATVEEIKGDIYVMQDKKALARNAYQAAIDADASSSNPSLQMKLDDLTEAVNLTK